MSVEVVEVQGELNARARVWVRVLGVAESTRNGKDRVRVNVTSTSGVPPHIYGLPKDHKKIDEGQEHPVCPVCSGDLGPNAKHSNLLAKVINPVNEEFGVDSQVESTEDLLAHIQPFDEQ